MRASFLGVVGAVLGVVLVACASSPSVRDGMRKIASDATSESRSYRYCFFVDSLSIGRDGTYRVVFQSHLLKDNASEDSADEQKRWVSAMVEKDNTTLKNIIDGLAKTKSNSVVDLVLDGTDSNSGLPKLVKVIDPSAQCR